MIKTLIGFSDIHLRPLARHGEYKLAFNKIINEIKDERPERVVIAGDIFHSKLTISNESSVLVGKLLLAISKYSKVIILPGNHDTVIGGQRLDSISPIVEILNNDDIVYYKESGCFIDKWDIDLVWCVWSCFEDQKSPEIKTFKQQNDPKGEKHYIGLYHGVIAGSTTDIGFSFGDEGMKPEDFYETDLFIAGDIHKHQTYKYPNYKGEAWGIMCSSIIQQNFGESLDKHGINLLEYKDNKWDYKLYEIDNDYDYHTLYLNDFEKYNTL